MSVRNYFYLQYGYSVGVDIDADDKDVTWTSMSSTSLDVKRKHFCSVLPSSKTHTIHFIMPTKNLPLLKGGGGDCVSH